MKTPERVASLIASVVQATCYLNPVWDSLPAEARQEIVMGWVSIIKSDREQAADLIIQDIATRPGLAEGWSRLSEAGRLGRYNCFVALITPAEPSAV